jgi:hypothetical protein
MQYVIFICFLLIGHNLVLAKDYNILDYGAIADAKTINTDFLQKAIDLAHQEGGGRVIVPEGDFLTGSIFLKSGVELHLLRNAVLLGSTSLDDYIRISFWRALILADEQENVSITGEGEIDGQGRKLALILDSLFYAGDIDSSQYNFIEMRPRFSLRPLILQFVKCKNIVVKDVRLKNAACWVQTYDRCNNVIIDKIMVDSDQYWNNDGIDITDSRNVSISNCYVNASDDGICIKSHFKYGVCDNIYITNCTVRSSASAIKIGTKSLGVFKNIVIDNIRVFDTFRSAIAIESVDGGVIDGVLVDNLTAINTGNAIFIKLGKREQNRDVSVLKNVTLRNIKAEVAFDRPDSEYEIRGPALPFFHNTFPSSITGIPERSIENLTLENIEIVYPGRGNRGMANIPLSRLAHIPEKEAEYPEFSMFGELPAWGFYVRHVDGLIMNNVKLKVLAPDYRPSIVFDDVLNLELKSMEVLGDSKEKYVILKDTKGAKIEDHKPVLKL